MQIYKFSEKLNTNPNIPDVEVIDTLTGKTEGYSMKDVKSPAIGTRENIRVLSRTELGGLCVDILQYDEMQGIRNLNLATTMWFMKEQNMKVRQVACYLNTTAVKIQAGAMSYFQGPMEMISGMTLGNAVGKMFKGAVTGERAAQPIYQGSGTLILEPTFKHLIPVVLAEGEQIIVDKGMFYLTSESVRVEPILAKNISSGLLGGEGWFQLSMTGPGIVLLESLVPMSEINIINLDNDILRVDGNFAILRIGNIDFTVERSAKTLVGSAASGEGLVNVYRGTGQVWVAPTIKVYNAMNWGSDIMTMDMNTSK